MKPVKKIQAVGGCIEIYPDKLYIEQGHFFKKSATIAFSDIKNVSAPFDRLNIETSSKTKYNLWFGANNHMPAFMAMNAIKAAMKDAEF